MALKSLQRSYVQRRGDAPSEGVAGPAYDYGLEIHLTADMLENLNMTGKLDVGEAVRITAVGKVTGAREPVNGGGESLDIQLTEMDLSATGEFEELSEDD